MQLLFVIWVGCADEVEEQRTRRRRWHQDTAKLWHQNVAKAPVAHEDWHGRGGFTVFTNVFNSFLHGCVIAATHQESHINLRNTKTLSLKPLQIRYKPARSAYMYQCVIGIH